MFSAPPIQPNRMVLMDYRADHLTAEERHEPPTFLYAMDLEDGQFFLSRKRPLAHVPGLPLTTLEQRFAAPVDRQRCGQCSRLCISSGVCFPMNNPLPYLDQPMIGFWRCSEYGASPVGVYGRQGAASCS
jgi:lycopene beta-cyclase